MEERFEEALIDQLPFLRIYASTLAHDWERGLDLVQDTCEKALRRRELYKTGTHLRAWLLTIMRHRFADLAKSGDALTNRGWVSLDEACEAAEQPARAEQICFAKEALRIARKRLSPQEASAFWPVVAGTKPRPGGVRSKVPKATVGTRLYRARTVLRQACLP